MGCACAIFVPPQALETVHPIDPPLPSWYTQNEYVSQTQDEPGAPSRAHPVRDRSVNPTGSAAMLIRKRSYLVCSLIALALTIGLGGCGNPFAASAAPTTPTPVPFPTIDNSSSNNSAPTVEATMYCFDAITAIERQQISEVILWYNHDMPNKLDDIMLLLFDHGNRPDDTGVFNGSVDTSLIRGLYPSGSTVLADCKNPLIQAAQNANKGRPANLRVIVKKKILPPSQPNG